MSFIFVMDCSNFRFLTYTHPFRGVSNGGFGFIKMWCKTNSKILPNPQTGVPNSSFSNTNFDSIRVAAFKTAKPITISSTFSRICKDKNWALKVSAPITIPLFDEDEREVESEFNPGAPPPFTLADIRASIPKHCWVKDPWTSMSYVLRDVVVIYWIAQSTMFWALFVLGHDRGHGSFSNNAKLSSVVGHLLHYSILVPYMDAVLIRVMAKPKLGSL